MPIAKNLIIILKSLNMLPSIFNVIFLIVVISKITPLRNRSNFSSDSHNLIYYEAQ